MAVDRMSAFNCHQLGPDHIVSERTLTRSRQVLCHSSGVSSIARRLAWTIELGPMNRLAHVTIPWRISPATPRGSCSATHPIRHPGRRNRFERPERVMMGTESESLARGKNGAFHVWSEHFLPTARGTTHNVAVDLVRDDGDLVPIGNV
jgi:hypothetical protein